MPRDLLLNRSPGDGIAADPEKAPDGIRTCDLRFRRLNVGLVTGGCPAAKKFERRVQRPPPVRSGQFPEPALSATKLARSASCSSDSCSSKSSGWPPTAAATSSGVIPAAASSRLGPAVPSVAAAARAWQEPQPVSAKTSAPGEAGDPQPGPWTHGRRATPLWEAALGLVRSRSPRSSSSALDAAARARASAPAGCGGRDCRAGRSCTERRVVGRASGTRPPPAGTSCSWAPSVRLPRS